MAHQKCISREHAVIRYDAEGGDLFVKDQSTLGTLLNGSKIGKGEWRAIHVGDKIRE